MKLSFKTKIYKITYINKYAEQQTNYLLNARGIRTPHISLLFLYFPDIWFSSVCDKTYRSSLLKKPHLVKEKIISGTLDILLLN
jgi:hypothetical protein